MYQYCVRKLLTKKIQLSCHFFAPLLLCAFALKIMTVHAEDTLEHGKLTLEFARNQEERNVGLMGRKGLPKDHGMLFLYAEPQKVNVWMYDCYFDLSVAFLDARKIITEIRDLKAYPDAMSLPEPMRTDFYQYTSISSRTPIKYILEVPIGWFSQHGVKVGDVLNVNFQTGDADFQ